MGKIEKSGLFPSTTWIKCLESKGGVEGRDVPDKESPRGRQKARREQRDETREQWDCAFFLLQLNFHCPLAQKGERALGRFEIGRFYHVWNGKRSWESFLDSIHDEIFKFENEGFCPQFIISKPFKDRYKFSKASDKRIERLFKSEFINSKPEIRLVSKFPPTRSAFPLPLKIQPSGGMWIFG